MADTQEERYTSSGRKRRSVNLDIDNGTTSKQSRRCERIGCMTPIPVCFAAASEKCAGSGYTSRWYHVSSAEHFCNECFDYYYRSHKPGYEVYAIWKHTWSKYGRTDPTTFHFMADQVLPYWAQCNMCAKWRELPRDVNLRTDFLKSYVCGMSASGQKVSKQDNACNRPEDERVGFSRDPQWVQTLKAVSLFRSSPAWPFLTPFVPDRAGMTPSDYDVFQETKCPEMQKYLKPFVTSDRVITAMSVHPEAMDEQEVETFPEFLVMHTVYLALRNICIALWNRNIKEWLTKEKCVPHIIVRGVNRIFCVENIERILSYLTRRGLINSGLVQIPSSIRHSYQRLLPENFSVIVVGAGTAGLAAANHMTKLGIKVRILEAKSCLGGRVVDDNSLGCCVGRGAQIVTGARSNPISLMCYQRGFGMKEMGDKCVLLNEEGESIPDVANQRMDFHFNALLDIIADWRRHRSKEADTNLLDRIIEAHKQFKEESQVNFTKVEEDLLFFHIRNLEYACGASLNQVSALSWDQNEEFPQFCGENIFLPQGYRAVLSAMAEGLDITYGTEVSNVDYSGENVVVKSKDGQSLEASKVLLTVPLTTLKTKSITFTPCLPMAKMSAISDLGVGQVEKVILVFSEKFWLKSDQEMTIFGFVPSTEATKSCLAYVFYDISSENQPMLMTHITGDGVAAMESLSDDDVIKRCMQPLRRMFPNKEVPDPGQYIVTRWYQESLASMAYTYLPVGCSGDQYDELAVEVKDKLYFAGEATNRQHPQSITGAYLSGVREADKIYSSATSV